MAEAFALRNSRNFWSEVKKVNKKSKGQLSVSSIDGVSSDLSISNLWAAEVHDLKMSWASARTHTCTQVWVGVFNL